MGIRKKFKGFSIVTLLLLVTALVACHKDQAASSVNGDPAGGNLAPANASSSGETYAPSTAAPYSSPQYQSTSYDQQPVQVTEAPPPLPVYAQPPCPGPDYVWTPGYWAYGFGGYYWVPGVWVLAPYIGALWTPPWWGFADGIYLWHAGYWAPYIGFYGGIDYGCGYTGRGYFGAYWNHGHLFYNRAVTNADPAVVHNVYSYQVPFTAHSRVSYNGGRGGITARPTSQELAVPANQRTPAVRAQIQHTQEAGANRAQFARTNHGRPATLTTGRPLATAYRAPAAPPSAIRRTQQRPEAQAPAREQVNRHGPLQATRIPENRPSVQTFHAKPQPFPQNRAVPRENRNVARRQAPIQRPEPRPAPQVRPETRPAPRGFVARAQPRSRPEQHNIRPPQPREERKQR
ncbi:MAG TPA: hypothetical protein VMB25_01670 [Bryobacteraceae bacterium]|nr:hypothetical protein [Bryobacteraceae bacterium]